jgi:N utilization substance protein A
VRELNNENIDLIEFTEQDAVFISRALAPAKVKDIQLNPVMRTATVTLPEDQVSLAIGKNGQNVRLASKLTNYQITLVKEGSEDIDIREFEAELGDVVLTECLAMNVNTAREFLNSRPIDLLELDGMTKENLIELRSIMLTEFDEEESEEILNEIKSLEI